MKNTVDNVGEKLFAPPFGNAAGQCALAHELLPHQSLVAGDGDLLLIDAGSEYDCYASDVTRTFPVNGRFSAPQKALYEVVITHSLRH